MGRADNYLQPDAADPVLADPLVLDLVRRHVPDAGAVSGVDESGGEARAYLVDDAIVLKTQRPHRLRPRTSLAKEAYLLDLLAPVLGGRIPSLLGHGQVESEHGPVEYLCMTRILGLPVAQAALSPTDTRHVLDELGRILRSVHSAPVELDRLPVDADVPALRRRLESGFADIADAYADLDGPSAQLPLAIDEVIGRTLAAIPTGTGQAPVLLHSNPGPTHVFVDPRTGQFTGLIDFGDSYASQPALDLHRWPNPADRIALLDAYTNGVDVSTEFRRMWTVAMVYTDLAAIAGGSSHAESAIADLTMRLDDM